MSSAVVALHLIRPQVERRDAFEPSRAHRGSFVCISISVDPTQKSLVWQTFVNKHPPSSMVIYSHRERIWHLVGGFFKFITWHKRNTDKWSVFYRLTRVDGIWARCLVALMVATVIEGAADVLQWWRRRCVCVQQRSAAMRCHFRGVLGETGRITCVIPIGVRRNRSGVFISVRLRGIAVGHIL